MKKRGIVALAVVAGGDWRPSPPRGVGRDRAHGAAAKNCAFTLRIGDVLPFTGDLAAYGANLDRAVKVAVDLRQRGAEAGRPREPHQGHPRRLGGRADAGGRLGRGGDEARQVEQGQRDHRRDGLERDDPDGAVGDDPEPHRPDLADLERAAAHRHRRQRLSLAHVSRPTRCRARCSRRRWSTRSARARRSTSAPGTTRSAPRSRQLFVAQYKKLGGKVGVNIAWNPDQTNFDSETRPARRRQPGGLGDHRLPGDVPEVRRRRSCARASGTPRQTFMTEALRNTSVLDPIGNPVVGLRGTAASAAGGPAGASFAAYWKKNVKGAKPYTGFEGTALDAANVAFLAALQACSSSPAKIKANLVCGLRAARRQGHATCRWRRRSSWSRRASRSTTRARSARSTSTPRATSARRCSRSGSTRPPARSTRLKTVTFRG